MLCWTNQCADLCEGFLVGTSYKRMKTVVREAVHMYCTPLNKDFYSMPSEDQILVETHVKKKVKGDFDIVKVAKQFVLPVMSD